MTRFSSLCFMAGTVGVVLGFSFSSQYGCKCSLLIMPRSDRDLDVSPYRVGASYCRAAGDGMCYFTPWFDL